MKIKTFKNLKNDQAKSIFDLKIFCALSFLYTKIPTFKSYDMKNYPKKILCRKILNFFFNLSSN